MINNDMKKQIKPQDNLKDKGNVLIEEHLKIFDPETKEVIINERK